MVEPSFFDGSPVVEDVWIDADGNGFKKLSQRFRMIVNGIVLLLSSKVWGDR